MLKTFLPRLYHRSCAFLIMAGLLFIQAAAAEEIAATNINAQDENIIPISYIRGHINKQSGRYVLGPGDEIHLQVQDMPEFEQKLTIRPDGYATVHPFGELLVSGTDVQGLQTWLAERFKFYLLDPQITVDITKLRPALIYITGAVQQPGTHQFIREGLNNKEISSPRYDRVETTLSQVLNKAGGVTKYADIEHIKVVHSVTGQEEFFNLREFLTSSGQSQDVWLLPGDHVYVPALEQAMDPQTFKLISQSTFYSDRIPVVVLGAVEQQGEVRLDPHNNSLNSAIALAGGFMKDRTSKTNQVIVQRPGSQGAYSRWVVDPRKSELELQSGDVVYVTHSKLATLERGLKILSQVTAPFFWSAAGYNSLDPRLPD